MSVLMAVRIPDDLAAQVDARGKRSAVIVEALRKFLGEATVEPKPKLRPRPGVTRETVQIGIVQYQRPAHAPGCSCLMCASK
jgi:hypothetical protein